VQAVSSGYSRLLVPALLRPFAEHLADMVRPQPGDVRIAVDTSGDDVLLRHLDNVQPLRAHPDALPLATGSAQVITALFAPLTSAALRELLRVLDADKGRLACALSVDLPGAQIGTPPSSLDISAPVRIERVRDVARFDGVAHYNAATGAGASADDLQPYVAPDGTLRIPVDALVVRAEPQ
jgi:hypothetical protein